MVSQQGLTTKRTVLLLFAIFVLALCLRLLYLADWATTVLYHVPQGDEQNFHNTALALLHGEAQTFLYQPLYSFYLYAIYSIFGVNHSLVRTLQLLISLIGIIVFYGLGKELAGKACGLVSATLVACYGPLIFFEGHLLAPGLVLPLLAGVFWAWLVVGRQGSWPWALLSGFLAGLVLMARPNLGLLLPVALVWLLYRPLQSADKVKSILAALIGLMIGLGPAMAHNATETGEFVPVSTAGGISFFLGNNEQASGRFHVPRGLGIDSSSHDNYRQSLTHIAQNDVGHPLSPAEVSSYWYQKGFEFWKNNPWDALLLCAKKMLLSINSSEMPIHHPFDFGLLIAPSLHFSLTFGIVFAFAVLGFICTQRNHKTWLLVSCFGANIITLIGFYVADRYRITLVSMLIPLAGLGIVRLYRISQNAWNRRSWIAATTLLIAFGLSQIPLLSPELKNRMVAISLNRMGKATGELGDLDQAQALFQQAISWYGPNHGIYPRLNLAAIHQLRGDYQQAQKVYLQATQIDPTASKPWIKLARLAEKQNQIDQAIRYWQEASKRSADPNEAIRQIQRLQQQETNQFKDETRHP